ncbi:MAG TPA: zinc-binding protein, partial [Desulfosporosinus sp.]|nr:zinc-binding protein [Desulfosporosinus sp.]
MFSDKVLGCKDCGREFEFTASEQEFYAEKGFTNEPGRCPECRAARKEQTRNNGGGGGGYSRQPREMFP